MDAVPSMAKPVVALEANDKVKASAFWARDLIIRSTEILRQQPSAGSDGEGNTRLDRVDPAENKVDPRNRTGIVDCSYSEGSEGHGKLV
ncbi:UNVERIFIED_CONTAM: hypothetical protein Sradi_6650100 [Sesamum radiatum]|uniref:Uncharacterized protein n=1 Tax=Sesamum radiatum TaxID=300843 RepID=A0AAW2JND8_SESRA